MVRDLYIIPLDIGAELPAHVDALETCTIKKPVEEKILLATLVVTRAPGTPVVDQTQAQPQQPPQSANGNGNGNHLPTHMRPGAPGPSGSPLNAGQATFSPISQPNPAAPQQQQQPMHAAYGVPPPQHQNFPPNPYGPQSQPGPGYMAGPPPPQQQQQQQNYPSHPNPLVAEILGPLQHAPTAQQVVMAKPDMAREQLEHLRRIMEEDINTRTDVAALASKLGI